MLTLVGVLALFGAALNASAQDAPPHAVKGSVFDAVGLKGQMWSSNGTYSPLEKGNVLSQSYFEQTDDEEGEGNGEYELDETGKSAENCAGWIAYIIALA